MSRFCARARAIFLSATSVCALIAGCATGGNEEPTRETEIATDAAPAEGGQDAPDAPDASAETAASVDTGATTDGHTLIFPVEPEKTCGLPFGTMVVASGSFESTPQKALDGNLGTYWNSGANTGTLTVKFPGPVTFDRVRIAAFGVPATSHTYGFAASSGTNVTHIGTATRAVPNATAAWLETIVVTRGAWSSLTVDVSMSQSWIALAEVTIFDSNAGCPMGP